MSPFSRKKVYGRKLWHKKFAGMLHVVVIFKTNLHTHKTAHVVLFSSDLTLRYDLLIDYYRLRFPLAFNFRDAKQYWGLEDFMHVNARPVYNGANLAMFMVNVSHALIADFRGAGSTHIPHYQPQRFQGIQMLCVRGFSTLHRI